MRNKIISIIYILWFSFIANSYLFAEKNLKLLWILVPVFVIINIIPGFFTVKTKSLRLRVCNHGRVLLTIFAFSLIGSVIYHIVLAFITIPGSYMTFIWSAVTCIVASAILFWNGIICVYLTSVQLGIKIRAIGAVCGMIPIVNLIVLGKIISVTGEEVKFEYEKEKLNQERAKEKICETKYPVLLVHGVFFRDSNYFNYWGRIPGELKKNGATIYYGNHKSAASVEDSAKELTERIKEIVKESGFEKLNVIAHSKGGIDMRYAISKLDAAPFIASLTTINTPHRGCEFAEFLLDKIPEKTKQAIADTYNKTLSKLGEENPDFLAAVNDLTASKCKIYDAELIVPEDIYCQSVGSVMNKARGGKFPMNFSYPLVKCFDGPNDGLVSANSFKWGENYRLVTVKGNRGMSHGDMIDLNRENIVEFDIREFYVQLLNDLRRKGL